MNSIETRNLGKCFDGEMVISGLNLKLAPGGRYCLRGPSGFGKTTLLRILAGLLAPDEGTITGIPARVAFVFQEDRLCEEFSAVENVALVAGDTMTAEEIKAHLTEVGLQQSPLAASAENGPGTNCNGNANFIARPVSTFSGGMKRRVAIVRAICYDADLLLLDEPFKGLDPHLRSHVADYILRHTEGKTIICVTHDDCDAQLLHAEAIDLSADQSSDLQTDLSPA